MVDGERGDLFSVTRKGLRCHRPLYLPRRKSLPCREAGDTDRCFRRGVQRVSGRALGPCAARPRASRYNAHRQFPLSEPDMRLLLLMLCAIATIRSQPALSRLEGIVEDPSGAAVTKAAITAENQQTGLRTTVLSDDRGLYVFPSLPPGDYTLTVAAPGFQTAKLTGLVLNVST